MSGQTIRKENSVELLAFFIQKPIAFLYTFNKYKMKGKILLIVTTKSIKNLEIRQTRYIQNIYGENYETLLKY